MRNTTQHNLLMYCSNEREGTLNYTRLDQTERNKNIFELPLHQKVP